MHEHPEPELVNRVQAKLQTFYDGLSEDERAVMEDILRSAAHGDGAALVAEDAPDAPTWLLQPPSFVALDVQLPGDEEATRIGIPVWPSGI